jgi:L-fuculose-phosphate aldolase
MTEIEIRETICEIGRRMYARNLVAATDGNISVRMDEDRYLCTPSGVSKGYMQPEDMIIADGQAHKLSGEGKVTSEFFTHLAAYEERPDINAVVHAHPPKAVGCTLAGIDLTQLLLPELVLALGGIPTADYATPATKEGGDSIRELIRECDAVMLDRHGSITVGEDVMDAYLKLEKMEHAAESLLVAHTQGKIQALSPDNVRKLFELREDYGIKGKWYQEK